MSEPNESDRKAARDLYYDPCRHATTPDNIPDLVCPEHLSQFRAQARAEERERVIEECAKVVETHPLLIGTAVYAAAIRALKEK